VEQGRPSRKRNQPNWLHADQQYLSSLRDVGHCMPAPERDQRTRERQQRHAADFRRLLDDGGFAEKTFQVCAQPSA
jgi:hypothetical protein